MKKKLISLVLAVFLGLTAGLAVFAGTAASAEIKADTTELQNITKEKGDEIVIPVLIRNNPGFASYALSLKYDETVFEACDPLYTVGKVLPQGGSFLSGHRAQLVAAVDSAEDGELFSVHLKVKKPVAETKIEIYLEPSQCICNANEDDVSVTFSAGVITFANAAESDGKQEDKKEDGKSDGESKSAQTRTETADSTETSDTVNKTPAKEPQTSEPQTGEPTAESPKTPSFSDVAKTAYYYDAVIWAAENNITSGVDADHFAPNRNTTRGQMVTFLWRAAGSPDVSASSGFSDVKAGSYYEKAILWAVANGITNGVKAGVFAPDAEVTRAQTVTFLYRFAKASAKTDASAFTDVAADAYYSDAVQWAVANGITNGTGNGVFSPNANCTRGQIVTFLYRHLVK